MPQKPLYHRQFGLSLIEVLISILVLSIGLLSLGGLQISSLKGSNNAHFRTMASLAATDLADRMRANPIGVDNGFYDFEYDVTDCDNPPAKLCEASVVCSPEELANYDIYRVNCGVTDGLNRTGGAQFDLPLAFMSTSCDVVPCALGLEHTILVRWNEADDDDNDRLVQTRTYELKIVP